MAMTRKQIKILCSNCGAPYHGTTCSTSAISDSRNLVLNSWLSKMDATPLTDCAGPNGSTLTWYSLKGHTIIVQRYPYDGYEIYMPPSEDNLAQSTFEAVERMIAEFEGRRVR